jgi:hypothetical protein
LPVLPPTVHERLARCGTHVYVSGLITDADVVLTINGFDHHHVATGASHTFVVPSLSDGASVRAKQDDGSGFSNDSPNIIVEEVDLPPVAAPQLPGQVGWCSHCVLVTGCVPGCEVELLQGGTTVGTATANRGGAVCMGVKLGRRDEQKSGVLSGRMIVCGQPGGLASTPIVNDPPLAKPVVGGPLYGCQRIVPLSQLQQGNRVRLETGTGTNLGAFCTCWNAVNVRVLHELVVGEKVRAQPFWDGDLCKENGPWSEWGDVVAPDEGITPVLLPALIETDQLIRVDNQIPGAELRVLIRDSETSPEVEFGPRPANESGDLEVALAEPLKANQQVSVIQELCGHKEQSEWLTVVPLPPVVLAPVVLPPLYACAGRIQVSNLHPGATVRVFQDGFPVGIGWSGMSSSLSIAANPGLVAGKQVHAVQWVGDMESLPSAPPVIVQSLTDLHPPRILEPVAFGESRVWVSGVSPGARVSIRSAGVLLGEAFASESIVSVPVNSVTGTVTATTSLCEHSRESDPVQPITCPCAAGPFEASGSEERSYTPDFHVSPNADGGDFDHPITGRLYYPADSAGNYHKDAFGLPLVVVAHGYWPPGENSYLGYGYLGHHLARWGMLVYSINLDTVNNLTSIEQTQQISRGEIILEAIRRIQSDPDLERRLNNERIGIVGHSMAGEGVAVAQDLNHGSSSPLSIRGVVSIAPTHYKPAISLKGAKYLQLYGSKDQLLGNRSLVTGPNADARFGGFRIYDRAARPKTHFWIYDARHNGFNTEWFNGLNVAEGHLVDITLDLDDHRRIAICLINAFFLDALKDQSEYAGYLEGIILPRPVRGYDIFTQHHDLAPGVVDDYGDADDQLSFAEESPVDKMKNRALGEAKAEGLGLGVWDDVEHVPLDHSVHDTRSLELSWTATDVSYRSDTGGLALSPSHSLSLRVSQFFEDAANNPMGEDLDFFVALSDGTEVAVVRLGLVASVPYPDAAAEILTVLRTGRLPLDAFKAVNPALDLGSIQDVRLLFMARGSGHVLVDDLEFVA